MPEICPDLNCVREKCFEKMGTECPKLIDGESWWLWCEGEEIRGACSVIIDGEMGGVGREVCLKEFFILPEFRRKGEKSRFFLSLLERFHPFHMILLSTEEAYPFWKNMTRLTTCSKEDFRLFSFISDSPPSN